MRISIDTKPLISHHHLRGIGWYTKRLLEALKQNNFQNTYIEFYGKWFQPQDTDVVHYPYFDPFFITLPLILTKPTVVTVHDLIPLLFPDHFLRGFRGEIKWQVQRRLLTQVTSIITDSEMSKKDIVKITNISDDKIHVIPLAPGEEFQKHDDSDRLKATKKKYGLQSAFLLYVGDLNYNKNISYLLELFCELRDIRADIELVVVGKAFREKNLHEAEVVRKYLITHDLEKAVHLLGYIPSEDLVDLYNDAIAYIQPSLYDGFGLPVVEAMRCGCPVIVSDIEVFHEICSNSAVYIDIHDHVRAKQAILDFLALTIEERYKMVDSVQKQSSHFSWKKVAEQTLHVYTSTANLSRNKGKV